MLDLSWVLLVTSSNAQAAIRECIVVIPEKERTRTAFSSEWGLKSEDDVMQL